MPRGKKTETVTEEPEVTSTEDQPVITSTRRAVARADEKPRHLVASGAGRTRKPTEFDDDVAGWYEDGGWFKIPAEGDSDEERLEDVETVFKAVNRAVQLHGLGVTRIRENDPTNDEFESYGVWVQVRERQERKRKNKTDDTATDNDNDSSDDDE